MSIGGGAPLTLAERDSQSMGSESDYGGADGGMAARPEDGHDERARDSAVEAVRAALLPGQERRAGDATEVWQVFEITQSLLVARVGVVHHLEAAHHQREDGSAAYVADLVRRDARLGAAGEHKPLGSAEGGACWALTHIFDRRQSLEWDVASAPDGLSWRMAPRYSPQWLRERERGLMARLRGALLLPGDEPLGVATGGTPVLLHALEAALAEQDRERATVVYSHPSGPVRPATPAYVVKLRWRRLTLRPYRSLGFWLIDSVARLKEGGR